MRTVLYTQDMEPITVIELNGWPEEFLKEHRSIRLPFYRPIKWDKELTLTLTFPYVEIVAEVFVRRGKRYLMLFTNDEESAMLLESVFLPGQRKELQEAERIAAGKGAAEMLRLIRGALGEQ